MVDQLAADQLRVLRINRNAEIVRLPWSIIGVFTGHYAVRTGKRVFDKRWKRDWIGRAKVAQVEDPVWLFKDGRRSYWWFHDDIYWDDDGLSTDDVKALVLQRERREQRKLQTAHSLMWAEENGRATRATIPTELRRAVFERDGGRCVECDSNFDLQYDHVLPVAHGGATTLENLQLLCAECNKRKGSSL